MRKNKHLPPREKAIQLALTVATWSSVVALAAVFGELLMGALPAFSSINIIDFFTGTVWNPSHPMYPLYGILPLFVGTLMVSFGAALIAIPVGLGCSIWLAELASPRVQAVFKPAIEILAGIPSVIFGFFALVILSEWIAVVFDPVTKLDALNGAIMLAVMMVPIMVTVAEDAMNAVPRSLREASLALGATRWETIRHVVVPASLSGVVAAIVLAFGRAVGETMTVLMATGNATLLHFDILRSVQTMTAAIAIDFGEVEFGSGVFYLYVCVDCALLRENLSGRPDLAGPALAALTEAAATVAPTGKQNSFASRAYAQYVLAEKGDRQPRSLATAFVQPVTGTDQVAAAIAQLRKTRADMDQVYGALADAQEELSVPDRDGSLAKVLDFVAEACS